MKKKKLIIFVVTSCSIIFIFVVAFLAQISKGKIVTSQLIQVYAENSNALVSSKIHDINPVVVKTVVLINGNKNSLLYTFQDRDKALQTVKKRDHEFIQLMMNKWKLDELSSSSWKTYKQNLIPYTTSNLPDDLGGEKYENQRQELESFLAIYQADDINQKTLKYIQFTNFSLKTKLVSQVSLDPIIGNFPFDSPVLD